MGHTKQSNALYFFCSTQEIPTSCCLLHFIKTCIKCFSHIIPVLCRSEPPKTLKVNQISLFLTLLHCPVQIKQQHLHVYIPCQRCTHLLDWILSKCEHDCSANLLAFSLERWKTLLVHGFNFTFSGKFHTSYDKPNQSPVHLTYCWIAFYFPEEENKEAIKEWKGLSICHCDPSNSQQADRQTPGRSKIWPRLSWTLQGQDFWIFQVPRRQWNCPRLKSNENAVGFFPSRALFALPLQESTLLSTAIQLIHLGIPYYSLQEKLNRGQPGCVISVPKHAYI